jgi:hypothetical protein
MYNQLCVWSGTVLGDSSVADLEAWFLEHFETRIQYKCEQTTNPDLDEWGHPIPDTGGRNDLFFYVHEGDVMKFAAAKIGLGVRWWEDVVKYNNNAHLYSEEFLHENPAMW